MTPTLSRVESPTQLLDPRILEVTSISLERLGQPQGLNVCLEGAIKERHQHSVHHHGRRKKGLTLDNVVEG